MKLYYSPGACSLASHIALIEAGIDYEAIRVDLSNNRTETGEDFRAINPRGYVPAIESQEIGLLSENPAALIYIADRAGAAPDARECRPGDPRFFVVLLRRQRRASREAGRWPWKAACCLVPCCCNLFPDKKT